MTVLIIAGVVALAANVVWFVLLIVKSPVIETDGEYRAREDREVAQFEAAWALPAFDYGIHAS